MTSSISALLISLTTLLSGLTAQLNSLTQVPPTTQVAQVASSQKQVLSPSDFSYLGYYDIQTYGNDTSYMRSLTSRYVNGQLRFLTLTHTGILQEFTLPSSYGGKVTSTTETWTNVPGLSDFSGLWFNQATNQLWVTGSVDYTVTYADAHIAMMTLNANGTISNVKTIYVKGIPEKRMYGGCQAVPAAMQAQIGGAYVCGYGGYTSLVMQAGGASMGPTLYAIPDPTNLADGSSVTAKTLLDAFGGRGVRKTSPENYFDGGDTRPNGSCATCNGTRPTFPPASNASYLSPRSDGLGWWTWGDSNYNTGMWIDTGTKQGFVTIASLAKGKAWYCTSTLCFDDRQYELHIWDPNSLNNGPLTPPTSMTEITPPRGVNPCSWGGDVPECNISGATYDSVTGRVYMVQYPAGGDYYTGRLYVYSVTGGGGTPIPTTPAPSATPIDAVVSSWSAWSDTSSWGTCANGTQSKTQTQTRTVVTPASNGGATPALTQTQTVSQSCTSSTTTQTTNTTSTGTSANNTRVPPAASIIDSSGNVWTRNGADVILNGVKVDGGSGSILWCNSQIYFQSGGWYSWNGSRFSTPGSDPCAGVAVPTTTTTPTPVNATVSVWSAWSDTSGWSACSAGTQTKTQQQTRTVLTPASNGGTTPTLSQTQTISQSCTVPVTPIPTPVVTKVFIGESIKTTTNVNVRIVGGGTLLGTQPTGSTGVIVAGPTSSNGVTWWQINYSDGVDGWSGDDFLVQNTISTTPVDATVSSWSAWTATTAWSTCVNSSQTQTQQRTRLVVTPASNGGVTPSLVDTQTVSQSCTMSVTTPLTTDHTVTTPTPETSTVTITKNLRFGMRGSDVVALQNYLIAKGYLASGNNSGYFGWSTYNAVRAFQKANGIQTTGYVGPLTIAAMK